MKGYIIDCEYIKRVVDYMPLPRPCKKLTDTDGSYLPLITVTVGLWGECINYEN